MATVFEYGLGKINTLKGLYKAHSHVLRSEALRILRPESLAVFFCLVLSREWGNGSLW